MNRISHSKPTISREDIACAERVLSSGKVADGLEVRKFENEMAGYIGQEGGVATNSGTNALFLALKSLDVKEEDEVIIPSFVCTALLNAVSNARAFPKIVDINEQDYNISINEINKAITKNTKAIILPHMFGDGVSGIEKIVSLRIPVVEDCAMSVGATINGRKAGSFGCLSVFSFYATKVMTTGHGGMILSKSTALLDYLEDMMKYDSREEYSESFNFRMTDFQAALGRSQLSRLEDFIGKRRGIANQYNNEFKGITSIKIPERSRESIYFRYIIEADDAERFIEKVSKTVECKKPVYKPLHHYLNLNKKDFPNTEKAYRKCVSVPIYPSMEKEEIEHVIKNIKKYA